MTNEVSNENNMLSYSNLLKRAITNCNWRKFYAEKSHR
jgi:hypothetical protein